MVDETILLIERAGKKGQTFAAALERKGYKVDVVPTGHLAVRRARAERPAVIVLNAASLGSSGVRIGRSIRQGINGVPIIHIMPDDVEDAELQATIADEIMIMPFTARKLINRVKHLLPGGRKDAIQVGPIRLAHGVRIVEAHGREQRLTPKTASLLAVFLKHPGEVLDRGFLMRQVWHTDYVGDTRTLDVHVRWVREAIEPDPTAPRHIVTVRGKGYRFEPEPGQGR
jgi:DNA-binding response OmpR family regulator